MEKNWIQGVDKEMEKKGTVGSFTKQAKKAGMSVQDFAKKVKDNPSDYTETTRKRAQFAINMSKISKNKKMEKGGETQKFNDKLNEDLGERLGRESDYKQSLKDRRDESKAGNKNLGRRAYSSVSTMDKGNRTMTMGGKTIYMTGGKMKYMEGGETQGYDDRDRESIAERNKGKKSQSLKSRMKESAGMEKSMGRRKYSDVSTMDKMARGGSVEGKIDRDRYVKLRREKDKTISKLKKEKGVLRKETKDCDKTSILPKVSGSNQNAELSLLAVIGGIFFGAYFSK